MAQAVSNAAITISLTQNESSALAALLYTLRNPELLHSLGSHGLAVNHRATILNLWEDIYDRDTKI